MGEPRVRQRSMFENEADQDAPILKAAAGSMLSAGKLNGPVIKFMYCTSWGYKNAFDQYNSMIQQRHPEIVVEGGAYPPPPQKKFLAQVVAVLKFLLLGCIIMGVNPLEHIGFGHIGATFWAWMSTNKIYAALMVFFLANFVENSLVSTGAFEIFFNDVPVWSKMQTGRVPSPPELLQIIDNNLKLLRSESDLGL